MKLLHVIPYYAPAWVYGGTVRAATDLTRVLAARGHHVVVMTTDTLSPQERNPVAHEDIDGVEVYRVRNLSNTLRGRLNLSSPRGMARVARQLIAEHRIDVVHCHEVRTVENLAVTAVAQAAGVPVVVSPHGTLPYETGRRSVKRGWDRLLGRRLLPRFDRVVALTRIEATQARAIWGQYGVDIATTIVPNGVHLDAFEALPPAAVGRDRWKLGDGPIVLFLGRLHERKGLQLLIPAFAQVIDSMPAARLLVVGPDEGMLATLRALVAEHALEEHVIFTGMLTGPDKLAAMAAADVFVLPAMGEGFSMAVLEAMACGLPVVLTPGCNFPEAAEAGAGVVVERSVGALGNALCDVLADRARLVQMGQAARRLVETRYTWPSIAAQLETVYEDVMGEKQQGAR